MKIGVLLRELRRCPLIASVQASPKSPVDHPETLLRLAKASLQEGVRVLRLEGVKNLRTMRSEVGKAVVIGLLKRTYPKSDVYITPAAQDVDSLLDLDVHVVALDATQRTRPYNQKLPDLIARIHRRGGLAMADCDTVESALAAEAAGADIVSTTLAGYTADRSPTVGPDLEILREICAAVSVPVIAEGRYSERWQVEAALRAGAVGVVVGGALNDPVKQTRALMPPPQSEAEDTPTVGAVDIGGTWLRFATFTHGWQLGEVTRIENPPRREDRLDWIRSQIERTGVKRVGVSTGGIVDARSGEVWTAKEYLMPDHIGIRFDEATLGVPTFAYGDGHATAWGHANLAPYAGRRVATLALGTGVGCGLVDRGRIWSGPRGEYIRINDQPAPGGQTFEDLLGGIHLTRTPSEEHQERARTALSAAVKALRELFFPDDIIIAGSVGLSPWLAEARVSEGLVDSPFGADAGLYGAAALALYPTWRT